MWLRTERRYAEGNQDGLEESIDDDDDEWDGSESERKLWAEGCFVSYELVVNDIFCEDHVCWLAVIP